MQNQKSKLKTDLKQRAYKYSIKIIEFMDSLPQDMSTSIIANQLLRSATSVGANLVEAKGSLNETRELANILGSSILTLKRKR